MAEIKSGLEIESGFLDTTGSLGKVYYHSFIGSAGTKACGVGTKVNTGSRTVHVGSGMVIASGKLKNVAINNTGTFAAAVGIGSVVCYNIEVGSDAVVDIVAGTVNTSVAYAIQTGAGSRAGSQAGHAPLGYLTVDDAGSLLAGSIVDDRTFKASTALNYGKGLGCDIPTGNPLHIWNGSAYAHSKVQRKSGKVTISQNFTAKATDNPWDALDDASNKLYMSVPRCAIELDNMGVTGTTEFIELLLDCVKENESVTTPEEADSTREFSAFYGSHMVIT